jgi:hypothetical protein
MIAHSGKVNGMEIKYIWNFMLVCELLGQQNLISPSQ